VFRSSEKVCTFIRCVGFYFADDRDNNRLYNWNKTSSRNSVRFYRRNNDNTWFRFFIYQRLKGREPYSQFSDFADWAFIVFIFLAGCTGFLLDFLTGQYAAVIMYIHLTLVFNLIVTAPFTKFAHAIYRTFALWLKEVQIK